MFEIFILSLIQSATEFLPVSSSGHLILAESFGISHQTLATDVALHVGTLVAVMAYFYKDILALLKGIWHRGFEQNLFVQLCIATLPVIIAGYFLHTIIETMFRSAFIVAFTSIFYGILLWVIDKVSPRKRTLHHFRLRDAFVIGLAQTLALIPGTSRSGITITAARALGLNRSDAAKFSMLLSIPTIGLSAAYVMYQTFMEGKLAQLLSVELLWGMGMTAVFGLIAVWFLMTWVKTASFAVFAIYRVILGLFLIFYFM